MDILAYGLWAGLTVKAVNKKDLAKKRIKLGWFIFWSIMPDIFTFTLIFFWFAGSILLGYGSLKNLPHFQIIEPMPEGTYLVAQITSWLYNFSHSLVIFVIIFALVFLFWKKIPWAMAGWLLHILIDIPTHSYDCFPTPFLWPLSQWKMDGWAWSTWHFEVFNYLILIIFYIWLYRRWLKNDKAKGIS